MEPLPVAVLSALTPKDVEQKFHDDRLELIPYDEPTDLVAISTEVYTAKRAYQIASEYRRRGVPVVMGGFHATLRPDEVQRYAESVVLGEAEDLWAKVIDDYRSGTPQKVYRSEMRPSLERSTPDRSIYNGKRYLPIGLVEAGRGCKFSCEFCAIQSFYHSTYCQRPVGQIVQEIRNIRNRSKLIFFVNDNIVSDRADARELLEALIPLKIRWVSQASINTAMDPEFLQLLKASGCQGLLIGFESMNPDNLRQMGKAVNLAQGDEANYSWHRATMAVSVNGELLGTLSPEKRFYTASKQGTSEVGIRVRPNEDLYLNFGGMSDDNKRAVIQAYVFPLVSWIWIGTLVVIFGTLVCLVPSKIKLQYARTEVVGYAKKNATVQK